jgi:imidazolonepropionase-like amidohydrolase
VTQPTGAEQGRIRPGYIADPLVVAGDALTDVSTGPGIIRS